MALAGGVACAIAILSYAVRQPVVRYDELALGTQNTSIFAKDGQFPIHISKAEEVSDLVAGWKSRGEQPVVLWLGNSQLHAINQAHREAQTAPQRVFQRMQYAGIDALTFSIPNANLQEHLVIFEAMKSQFPIQLLILPVVFDDFRETDIRDSLHVFLQKKAVIDGLKHSPTGRQLLAKTLPVPKSQATESHWDTYQDKCERKLETFAESHSAVFAARGDLRSRVFATLYQWRNRCFGIDAQTIRRKIESRYDKNWLALLSILGSADESQIPVLLYVAPLRRDVAPPYDPAEYELFRANVLSLDSRPQVIAYDLESTVPGELWGTMADIQGNGQGYDFMHFQEGGHELLASEILQQIARLNGSGE